MIPLPQEINDRINSFASQVDFSRPPELVQEEIDSVPETDLLWYLAGMIRKLNFLIVNLPDEIDRTVLIIVRQKCLFQIGLIAMAN